MPLKEAKRTSPQLGFVHHGKFVDLCWLNSQWGWAACFAIFWPRLCLTRSNLKTVTLKGWREVDRYLALLSVAKAQIEQTEAPARALWSGFNFKVTRFLDFNTSKCNAQWFCLLGPIWPDKRQKQSHECVILQCMRAALDGRTRHRKFSSTFAPNWLLLYQGMAQKQLGFHVALPHCFWQANGRDWGGAKKGVTLSLCWNAQLSVRFEQDALMVCKRVVNENIGDMMDVACQDIFSIVARVLYAMVVSGSQGVVV